MTQASFVYNGSLVYGWVNEARHSWTMMCVMISCVAVVCVSCLTVCQFPENLEFTSCIVNLKG